MSVLPSRRLSILALILIMTMPALAAEVVIPPASSGSIDGKIALRFWPARFDAARSPLPTDDCQAHVLPADSMSGGRLYPCGRWFQPSPGRYLVWLEQRTSISPQTFITFDYLPFRGLGQTVMMPMKPAGWLRVNGLPPANSTIRILSMATTVADPRAFDRRLAAAAAETSVLMPAGNAVIGYFDALGNAVALSKPVNVIAGETITVTPEQPPAGRDVLLSLMREGHKARGDCQAVAIFGGAKHPADVLLNAWDRVVAIWYRIDANAVRLTVQCPNTGYERSVQLGDNAILTLRGDIQ